MATATAWNYEKTRAPYSWFATLIDTYDMSIGWGADMNMFLEDKNNAQQKFTKKLLEIADINIADYDVNKVEMPSVSTFHNVRENGETAAYSLDMAEESRGTQNLF